MTNNNKYNLSVSIVILLTLFTSCTKEKTSPVGIKKYAFFGHTYQDNETVDKRVRNLDLSVYDQIWLGGDICAESTQSKKILKHIDHVFNLNSPTTHWTVGNHDVRNGNLNWITDFTQKPLFYATYFNGITLLNINTTMNIKQYYSKDDIQLQYKLIKQVCDTISKSKHLIILSHHSVWNGCGNVNNVSQFSNQDFSSYLFSVNPKENYKTFFYPLLVQLKKRGINIIHIAGDFGQLATEYSSLSQDGINFIGSGITSESNYNKQFSTAEKEDKYLILTHNELTQKISWKFEVLPNFGITLWAKDIMKY